MLSQHILAALGLAVASVSAIDLRFFRKNSCNENVWMACNNYDPKKCCRSDDEAYSLSAGLFAIPKNWNIVGELWKQSTCHTGPLVATELSRGRDTMCWGGAVSGQKNYARGLSYFFNGPGRREVQESEGCERANILHLADGSEFDLSSLDNSTYKEVVQMSVDATTQAEIAKTHANLLIS